MIDHVQVDSSEIVSHSAKAKALTQGYMENVLHGVMVCTSAFWATLSARAS